MSRPRNVLGSRTRPNRTKPNRDRNRNRKRRRSRSRTGRVRCAWNHATRKSYRENVHVNSHELSCLRFGPLISPASITRERKSLASREGARELCCPRVGWRHSRQLPPEASQQLEPPLRFLGRVSGRAGSDSARPHDKYCTLGRCLSISQPSAQPPDDGRHSPKKNVNVW